MRKTTPVQTAGVVLISIGLIVLFYAVILAGAVWIIKAVWN